eukprot:gene18873-20773_t
MSYAATISLELGESPLSIDVYVVKQANYRAGYRFDEFWSQKHFLSIIMTTSLLFLLAFTLRLAGASSNATNNTATQLHNAQKKVIASLNKVIQEYDKKLRPHFLGPPVHVLTEVKVVSFGPVNEEKQEYNLDIVFRQWWKDDLLQGAVTQPVTMAIDPGDIIWKPDTYFVNAVQSEFHDVTKTVMRLVLQPDGSIYYSSRISLTVTCQMDFSMFPLDTQKCPLYIETYSYTVQEVYYSWYRTYGNLAVTKGVEWIASDGPIFKLINVTTLEKDVSNNTKGAFSRLTVNFYLQRRYGYYIWNIYLPGGFLVVMTWVNFWIPTLAYPARVTDKESVYKAKNQENNRNDDRDNDRVVNNGEKNHAFTVLDISEPNGYLKNQETPRNGFYSRSNSKSIRRKKSVFSKLVINLTSTEEETVSASGVVIKGHPIDRLSRVVFPLGYSQWNSYEMNETPLLKRLYWLKYPSDLHETDDLQQFQLYDNKDNSLSESESSSNSYHPYTSTLIHAETSKMRNVVNIDDKRFLLEKSTAERASSSNSRPVVSKERPYNDDSTDTRHKKASPAGERGICYICRKTKPVDFLRTLHTRPQMKMETPFYPSLANLHSDANQQIDSQGRVHACDECHQSFFSQWQLYTKTGTPYSERQYSINRDTKMNRESMFVCFLCGLTEPAPAQLLCCKNIATNLPYFPFLQNLKEPVGAETIDGDGNVKACEKCSHILYKQWDLYRKTGMSIADWVFSVPKNKEQDIFVKLVSCANVADDLELLCFICQKKELRKGMKEVYSNPYANMDLSFLDSMEKVAGTYFSKKLGQSLVCQLCYESLKNQWSKFDKEDVPLNRREYMLKRYEDKEDESLTKCEICLIDIPAGESQCIHMSPRSDKSEPYFPLLAKLAGYIPEKSPSMRTCKLCYFNLVCQWNFYETMSQTDEDRLTRHYKPHHFVCFICGDTTHRLDSKVVDQRLCKEFIRSDRTRPACAIMIENLVVVCTWCKTMMVSRRDERQATESVEETSFVPKSKADTAQGIRDQERQFYIQQYDPEIDNTIRARVFLKSEEDRVPECAGMKVTATVQPLPSLAKRNHDRSLVMPQNQSTASHNDDEGSFAAALRKLAQQAIVPVPRKSANSRERQPSPSSSSYKSGSSAPESHKSPSHSRHQSQSPFYMRPSGHPGSIPSSLAPVIPPSSVVQKEKAEISIKPNYGHPSSTEDSVSQRLSRAVIPGIFPRNSVAPEGLGGCFRPTRDEAVRRHGEKSSLRESSDAETHILGGSTFANGQHNMHGIKDRGSNIGLVHPQPVRKLPEEDPSKSGILAGARCNPLDGPSSLFRPLSPTEGFSRYPMMPGVHQHSSQGPCPVHGHEAGHHHGSPGEHSSRGNRLPFDGLGSSDFRGMHPHHPRLRDEMYNMNRLPVERREPVPSQIIEEDMRRRGYDLPWPVQHPMFDNDHYRRHLINGFRGHEHAYKDLPHGQMYYSPHNLYGPEYPVHVDPYAHASSLPHRDVYPRRYPSGQLSPRLMDLYRRERNLSDRAESRRTADAVSEKLDAEMSERNRELEHRRSRIELVDERRSAHHHHHHFRQERKDDAPNGFPHLRDKFKASSKPKDEKSNSFSVESISGRSQLDDEPRKKLHIMERLELMAKPPKEPGPVMDSVVIIKEEPQMDDPPALVTEPDINETALSQNDNEAVSKWPSSDDSNLSSSDLVIDDADKKMDYMSSLGLIPYGKRRALEEDYERKRWERKVRKMKGRPKKRRRREQTDDSEGRPCSEMDFYNGPMTRHKQQLLQEQEMLLEQVQKNQEEHHAAKKGENDQDKLSDSFSSGSTNSTLVTSPPNLSTQPHHPLSIETNHLDSMATSYPKTSHLLKLYENSADASKNRGGHSGNIHDDPKKYLKLSECNPAKRSSIHDSRHAKELDYYVFGRRHIDEAGFRFQWSGIEEAARSYIAYKHEHEMQESKIRKMNERLKSEDEMLTKQRLQLQKDIVMLREKRSRLSENRQKLQSAAKSLHQTIQNMAIP